MEEEKPNTYYIEPSRGENKIVDIESASRKVEEASKDPHLAEEVRKILKESIRTGEKIKKGVDSNGEFWRCEITPSSNGSYKIIIRRRTEERKTELQYIEKIRRLQLLEFAYSHTPFTAHEIINVFSVLKGRTDLLQKQYPSDHNIQSSVESMLNVIKRGGKFCNSLMKLFQETDEIPKLTTVKNSLDRVINDLEKIYELNNVTIETNYSEDLPQIKASDDLLYSLWFNLIKNAFESIKAIDEEKEGKIIISTEPHYKYLLKVSISDNGCGMDEETKIAWKHQDSKYFSKKEKGHGVGRHIIFDTITKFNMAYSIESELGKGTKFLVYFPNP